MAIIVEDPNIKLSTSELREKLKRLEEEFEKVKNGVAFGKNLLIWVDNNAIEEKIKLHIKVTDFKKGYWAETPLTSEETNALLRILLRTLDPVYRGSLVVQKRLILKILEQRSEACQNIAIDDMS